MKFDRNKTFPYPVLRPYSDDYIDGEFQALTDFYAEGASAKITVEYRTSISELLDQIAGGRAKYLTLVSCRDTYLREVYITDKKRLTAELDSGVLQGEVRIDSYIVATGAIHGFSSPDINPEFGQSNFVFTPGDVLAQDETQVFFADRDLYKPVTSVFELVKNPEFTDGQWRIDLDEDHIRITLNTAMKESIDNARNNNKLKVVLLNSIYFSAAVHAIQRLKDNSDDYEDRKWSRVFFRQIHNNNLDLATTDAYVLAQQLMKYPLRALDAYLFKEVE